MRAISKYTMELEPGSGRGTPACYASGNGYMGTNGLLVRRHYTNDLTIQPPVRPGRVADGLSKTVLVGESSFGDPDRPNRSWQIGVTGEFAYNVKNMANNAINSGCRGPVPCTNPARNNVGFGSQHAGGGTHFAMGDGSVHFISENIEVLVLMAMASRSADDTVTDDVFK
jgi:hypothetical protein